MSAPNFVITFAVALLGGLVATVANAEQRVNQRLAGTILPTQIDSNGDDMTAGLALGETKGSPGSGQLRGTIEFAPPLPPGVGTDCSATELQFNLVAGGSVQTFADLSQLFFENTSGYFCLDLDTGAATSVTEGIYTGGTGRFEGASGSATVAVTVGLDVAADISVVNGTIVGTLVLP